MPSSPAAAFLAPILPMSERIVCKPTPWFLLRAAAMLLMFGIFSVLFFRDGKWGYREQNLSYHMSKAFEKATTEFKAKKDSLTPEAWRAYAEKQVIDFIPLTKDESEKTPVPVPEGTPVPMPWPAILHDYEAVNASLGQEQGKLFNDYRQQADIKKAPPEKDFPERKVQEQWVVFWICLVLTAGAAAVLLRTLGRKMVIDDEGFYPASGGKFAFADLARLDLRKWDTKGLAFAWAKTPSGGEKKLRIDGLTYGGFKKEDDEPAERLMRRLKEKFSGELIEYVTEVEEPAKPATPGA
ncbi:hypothetical protein OKA04_23940 [Luteolibacter flavescens]|uniref:Transmembrane protein n=1 Tax=Luteolibacter flavescens TaxID=1859460 RepID=A0ABT3FX39_9BACT|nr:hypothetical protein [Luteolibacter flavescens]MCW1887811.1 hypothetical protein [Luteolibacter flavescens]